MREKLKAFYYPEFWPARLTLIKAILIFDEIHFMDRPSFTFHRGGTFGLIGAASPMRRYERSFRENGTPVYVHSAPGGPVPTELMEAVELDISDPEFLERFQKGLAQSEHFRDLQITPGNYGGGRTNVTLAADLASLDLTQFPNPIDVLEKVKTPGFDTSTPDGAMRTLVMEAMFLSAKMNYATEVSSRNAFTPFADALPFQELLSVKYRRAVKQLESAGGPRIPLTDITLAVVDDIMPSTSLEKLNITDAVRYRKKSAEPREAFLEYLVALHRKIESMGSSVDYKTAVGRIIETEVRPAAREFRNRLQAIHDKLFGTISQEAVTGLGGAITSLHLFGDLSWPALVALSGKMLVGTARATIDALQQERATKRECALSYLLDLGPHAS